MTKSIKVLFVIILVVVLVLLVWFFFVKDVWQYNQFSVTCNGKTLVNNQKLNVNVGSTYKFKVTDGSATDKQSFSVKLVAHSSKSVVNMDERNIKLADLDLTEDFVSDVTANGFTLCQSTNLRALLMSKYGSNTITVPNENILFDLVITSANGKNVLYIPLYSVGVTINPPHVVF